jgi:non-lysosomal glucosylceramidase
VAAVSASVVPWQAMAGPFQDSDFERLVPADKKLSKEWVKSLFERGSKIVYRGTELEKIGMPVGGLCAGQVYLGGDGRLWHWDIFNQHIDSGSGGPHYANPMKANSPFAQGFSLRLTVKGKSHARSLDQSGWRDVSFTGQYPFGFVEYRDPESPVTVNLEAFSPFIPLNPEDSSLPAIVMSFTLKNISASTVGVELAGWLENAVCLHSAESASGCRRNRILHRPSFTFLECTAEPLPQEERVSVRPDLLFEDFEKESYDGWTVSGLAFGNGPVQQDQVPSYQGTLGIHGQRTVNTHATAPGDSVQQKDSAIGTLTSRTFKLERNYIAFLIGGGSHKDRTCLNLLVEGKRVLSATGRNDNRMQSHMFDVRRWAGMGARLEIVDQEGGPWGNIGIDNIVLTDQPGTPQTPFALLPDFGSIGLALIEAGHENPKSSTGRKSKVQTDSGCNSVPPAELPNGIFDHIGADEVESVSRQFDEKLIGSLSRKFSLGPGKSETVTFLVCWNLPNLTLEGLGKHEGRWYGKRFRNALEVAAYVVTNFKRLNADSRLWHETWYDSTLPFWFLDRTFLNTSILATSTSYLLGNNRFYGWEGVGCCAGTCGHVWQYAQAVGRLFPSFERNLRETVDYGVGFDRGTGRIRFRAEHNDMWAVDAQAGIILRTYREHQMSADTAFLRRVWPSTKKALQFLISKDAEADGIINGPQHNTLDTDWWGEISWLSGLYLGALQAGAEMALEMGDSSFASECQSLISKGRKIMVEQLFNGEYFINQVDSSHFDTINSGTGCEIDQVFGQSWAFQVGLHRILPEQQTLKALRSLWRYNFTPDVGPYRLAHKPGRWYAMPGEAGLLMCTFPKADWDYLKASGKGPDWAAGYFNECMNGFEYQVAGHMIWEGMVLEGLAVTRAVHDRYHASRRNPWNEIECGDHYARSMASYGVFLAACGFEYHGPKGRLGFAPRVHPENFRSPFTSAEGWGTFSQKVQPGRLSASVEVKWGRLNLQSLALRSGMDTLAKTPKLKLNGKSISGRIFRGESTLEIHPDITSLQSGDRLDIEVH